MAGGNEKRPCIKIDTKLQHNASTSTESPVQKSPKTPLKHYKHVHLIPIHKRAGPSPLSTEAPVQNYRGLMNLALLMLFVKNLRLIVENYLKYGNLISLPGGRTIRYEDSFNFLLGTLLLFICCVVAVIVEKLRLLPKTSRDMISFLATFNLSVATLLVTCIVWFKIDHPLIGGILIMASVILGMKLFSYHAVNKDLYELSNKKDDTEDYHSHYEDFNYPDNITFGNFGYFWLAPTLCYQPVYPRTERIRKAYVLKRSLEFIICIVVMYFILEQYVTPTVKNSLKPMSEMHWAAIVERLLKLSVPSLYIWLLMFYAFFHVALNLTAELLRFGDRNFYQTWWNANTLDEYWRLWNMPVHNWLKRHVYVPLRRDKYSSLSAMAFTFFLSAVLHEVIIGIPTKIIQGWAFGGMVFQLPLILITGFWHKKKPESSLGNYFFWLSFCIVGQPMSVLLYYYAYNTKN